MKEINLTHGLKTLVDDDDFEFLLKYHWYAHRGRSSYYAYSHGKTRRIMHRIIMRVKKRHEIIDHIDGDGLNNQRSNLRVVTSQQNSFNRKGVKNRSSKYKGVGWSKHAGKWRAYAMKNRRWIHLGYFTKQKDAALSYNEWARSNFKEFSLLNSIHG